MEKVDRRIRKTQQQLGDALIALIMEKNYDAITVKDITDRADVAHATFYRHYRDKDELLARRLEAVVEEIEAFVREPSLQDAEGYLIFKHAHENSILYRILLSSPGTMRVRKHIKELIAENVLKTCKPLFSSQHTVIPPEAAANHIAGSMLLLIEWWLEHEMPHPPHRMARIYQQLITDATMNAINNQVADSNT
ncbi:MAG: TetR/AcrR family transcriptional regulator [Anaerolineae bacterium]|nr:TetR/AcrR family transcriptional regulator [Anaerolineae bacterium]